MLKPIFTEKTIKMAKDGKYSFWVSPESNKTGLKSMIAKIFGVHVESVRTAKKAGEKGRNARGRKFVKLSAKKAIVTLKAGEKLDIFEEGK